VGEPWGQIAFVIVPNDHHRLDAAAYKARYPEARVICPAGARAKIEQKVKVDATEADLGDTVRYRMLGGTRDCEGWLEIQGGTLVLGDLIMNLRPMRGFGGWIMNCMGFSGDSPKVVPATKKVLVADREAARKQIEGARRDAGAAARDRGARPSDHRRARRQAARRCSGPVKGPP